MTPNEKDYMDRYIYQVIHRLPKAQREEVRMELEELISDMYADRGCPLPAKIDRKKVKKTE